MMLSNDLVVRRWTEDDFLNNKKEWQDLLDSSLADKLFLSWDWMHSWWTIWGKKTTSRLHILAVYQDDELVGLAPLYFSKGRILKNLISVTRLEFVGTMYKLRGNIRAEYLEFITKKEFQKSANNVLLEHIYGDRSWDVLIFSDLVVNGETYRTNQQLLKNSGCYSRIVQTEDTYVVDCTSDYSDYIADLGKNTRLKFYNRRKQLVKHGTVSIEYVEVGDLNDFIDTVNELHLKRFSKRCFNAMQRKFILEILEAFSSDKMTSCSQLKVDSTVISAMVNIQTDNKVYNIQLGFLEDFDRKIAPGTLHLGYVIESVFGAAHLNSFDLLAGTGKNSNYKARFSKPSVTLETSEIIRKPVLKLLYFLKDYVLNRVHTSREGH